MQRLFSCCICTKTDKQNGVNVSDRGPKQEEMELDLLPKKDEVAADRSISSPQNDALNSQEVAGPLDIIEIPGFHRGHQTYSSTR